MRAHIVLAHPENQSFNGHLASISQQVLGNNGYQTTLTDLYGIDFDPREGPHHYRSRQDKTIFHTQTEQRYNADNETLPPEVVSEIEKLEGCDLLVVHFPFWWFGMPAILKGWMDRVFVYGPMYRSSMRYDTGVCAGKKVIICVTTGASDDACSHNGKEGDTRLHLWPVVFPFRYLGFDVLEPEIFHGVGGVAFIEGQESGANTLAAYSSQWKRTLEQLPARPLVPYNSDSDFDESKRLVPDAQVFSPFVRHNPKAI